MEDNASTRTITRRGLLKKAAAAGIAANGIAAAGIALAEEADLKPVPEDITATYDCDIVVVGCGTSGLAASVQAADLGAKVITLESSSIMGGGASGIEGTFAIDSPLSKAAGVTVDKAEVLYSEMDQSQWRANGLAWIDLIEASGDNIQWLMDMGAEFDGAVDGHRTPEMPTFHWWKGLFGLYGYTPQMSAKAEELGVQVLLEHTGKQLVYNEDNRVAGVYATTRAGEWVQVNAKAVILASGGFGNNPELVARMGYDVNRCVGFIPYAMGYGLLMGLDAGAQDMSQFAADNVIPTIMALPRGMADWEPFNQEMISMCCEFAWINEKCERFFCEDVAEKHAWNLCYQNPPQWNEKNTFVLFDQGMLDDYAARKGMDYGTQFDDAMADETNTTIFRADNWDELAEKFGLDPQKLNEFVADYNAMCEGGVDTVWGKNPKYLVPINRPPYYIVNNWYSIDATIGGVATNRNQQAITPQKDPIPGLYAVGMDGCMLYRNVYTINVPGTMSAFCVHSGRTAAKHAVENCL